MRKFIQISLISCVAIASSCCVFKQPAASIITSVTDNKIDTFYYQNIHNSKKPIAEYKQFVSGLKFQYGNLMVSEIHSPLNIEKQYYDKVMGKFQKQLDEMLPALPDLEHFKKFLYAQELKTRADFESCSYSIIPIYRMTANIMNIESFETQQFADFCTLDTINHVVMVQKEGKVIDLFLYYKKESLGDMGGDKISAVELSLKKANNVVGIVGPEHGGSIGIIFGYIESGRLMVTLPIGDISIKNSKGENGLVKYIYCSFDNDIAFERGKFGTTWLESYFKAVEHYRKNPDAIWVKNRDPQFIVYPRKK